MNASERPAERRVSEERRLSPLQFASEGSASRQVLSRLRCGNETKQRWRRVGAVVAWLVLSLALPGTVLAQADDWEVERGDLKEKKIERYKELIARSAEESYAFVQLMKTVGRGPDYDKLVAEYKAKVEADPSSYINRMLLGHMLRRGEQYAAALEQYEAARGLEETALVHECIGLTHEANKSLDAAIESYEKSLGLAKDLEQKERLLRALGSIALHRRHLDKAKEYFAKLVELDKNNLFLRKELSQLLIENKLYDEALAQLEAAREIAGRNMQQRTQIDLDIGAVYELKGQDEKAIEIYRDAAKSAASDSWLQTEVEERVIAIYRRQNNIEKLVEYYLETWRSPNFDQLMILARLYEELGDDAKALEYVGKAIKNSPKNPDARAKLIQILERSGDIKAVIQAYREVVKALPGEAGYRFELAELLMRTQAKDDAIKVLEECGKAFKSDPEVHLKLADKYMSWDLRDKALEEYKLLVKLQPDEPAHLESLGEFYFQSQKRDLALETWKKVLTVIADAAEAHVYLGRIYGDHGMTEEAVKEYKEGIAAKPDNLQFRRDLAELYERSREFNDAIVAWEELLTLTQDKMFRREARQHIISILNSQGTLRASLFQYERAFEAQPPDLEAGYFLSEAYVKLGELDEAARILESILVNQKDDIEALLALEKVYGELGELEKSIALLQRLAELDVNRSRVYLQKIADAYLRMGKPDDAEQWMIEILRANANDARSYAKLGDVYRKKQQYEKAAEMYEQAISVDPRAFDQYFVLAEIYAQLHRDVEGDKLYRAIAQQAIDEAMVLRAARRAVDYNAFSGTLDNLEQDFAPLLHKTPKRPVYNKIMVELYLARCQGLIAAARSGAWDDAQKAREELREVGRRAIKPLLDALNEDDAAMKLVALDLIGEIGNANATLQLSVLLDEKDRKLSVRAALALARIADARTVPFLVKAAGQNYERRIRELAVWGLGRSSASEAVTELESLSNQSFITVRALAAIGLGRLGGGKDKLTSLLKNDTSALVRAAAAWGLSRVGDSTITDTLIQALRNEKDPSAAAMAAWALGAVGDDRALEPLLDAYWSDLPELREVAAKALLRWGTKTKPEPSQSLWEENVSFINLSADDSKFDVEGLLRELQRAEMRALPELRFTPTEAQRGLLVEALRLRLSDESVELQRTVLADLEQSTGLLASLADGEAAPILVALDAELIQLLGSKDATVRWQVCSVLANSSGSKASEALIERLRNDDEVEVRRRAALALGRSKVLEAYAPLVEALGAESFALRADAAWALGMLGNADAVEPLLDRLDDPFTYVAAMAARGLGLLGDARAVEALDRRADKANPSVQAEIVRSLVRLGAVDKAARFADSPHRAVREALVGAP